VAAESPFSSFREIAYDRVGQFFHLGPWLGRTLLRPIVEAAFLYARWKYQLNFEHLSPQESVAKTKVPVLLIHGTGDTNIPIRHSRRIAENSNALLWEVPDAEHCGAMSMTPKEFEQRLVGWFTEHSGSKIRWQQALSLTPRFDGRQRGRERNQLRGGYPFAIRLSPERIRRRAREGEGPHAHFLTQHDTVAAVIFGAIQGSIGFS
jgi:prolyl oligopeptidase family protein